MKTSDKISLGALLVAIIALGLAIFSTIKSCKSSDDLKITNDKLSAIEYRPRIRFFNPIVNSVQFVVDSLPQKPNSNIEDSIGDVEAQITLNLRLNYKNIGNSTAKMVAFYITDTTSDKQVIKDLMFKQLRINNNRKDKIRIPHHFEELTLLDTSHLDVEHKIQFISNKTFTIHILAFYQNELGNLFDTYYWINYKTSEFLIPNPQFSIDDFISYIQQLSKEILQIIEFNDENDYSSPYSKNKSLELMNMFEN